MSISYYCKLTEGVAFLHFQQIGSKPPETLHLEDFQTGDKILFPSLNIQI